LANSEQLGESYSTVSASRLVPLLKDGDAVLTQSLAIIEYLDETHPQPPLLPADALGRARVRALAHDMACEIHPLNNLRVLRYLTRDLKLSEDDKNRCTAIGSRPAWRWSSANSPRSLVATATVRRRPWRIACWCRRSSTRSASTAAPSMCPT